MKKNVLVRIVRKDNYICAFPDCYGKDKEMAQWYMENIKKKSEEIYKAKWTDNGLIYTHKLNVKGEFEPIEDTNK